MDTLLIAACGGLLVFFVARFLNIRLTLMALLGAGAVAAFGAWLITRLFAWQDPVKIQTEWAVIPVITLAIGAVLTGLLLKVAKPLR